MGWKSDWLYQLIFREIKAVWNRAQREAANAVERSNGSFREPPEMFYIFECGTGDWKIPSCKTPVLRAWTYDGETTAQIQIEDPANEVEEVRGAFYRRGLIQFHIATDRKKVIIRYILGPLYGRGYVLKTEGQGLKGRLIPAPDFPQWGS